MKKEMFDYYVKNKLLLENEEDIVIVKRLTNRLIDNLYKPSIKKNSNTFVTDNAKLKKYLLTYEAVNWGDLHCTEVIKEKEIYRLIIEEALGDCGNLCKYITKFMNGWGWNVEIEAEW